MPLRTRVQVVLTWLVASAALGCAASFPSHSWLPFALLGTVSILSSGFYVKLPRSDGSMSANFPFLLLGLVVLSPLQALLVAAGAVARSSLRARTARVAVQAAFNIANTIVATGCAYATYAIARHHIASAPALALAAVVYFVWNTGSFAAIIAPSRDEKLHKLWLAEFPWYLPLYLLGATLAAFTEWLAFRVGWPIATMLIPAVYLLYRLYIRQAKLLAERDHQVEEIEALHGRIIEGLAMAIEAKDQNTHDHLFRVRTLVMAVGKSLKLSELELKALGTAAFLHDIGKLAVPEHIINKPGKLTPEEFRKMTIHPGVGAEILRRVRFPYPVVPIVQSHHEWWNGAGYPDGLQGEAIPIGARILTVVDCYDALVSDRPYRKGMSEEQALRILQSLSGKQFDPAVLHAFEESLLASENALHAFLSRDEFTPLNTAAEVWRGLAPGAGFEAGSDENAPARTARAPERDAASSLRVAEAREIAQGLFELGQTSDRLLGLNDFLHLFARRIHPYLEHDACALYVKANGAYRLRAVTGESRERFTGVPIRFGEGITGWVAQSGRPLLNGNTAAEPGCPSGKNGRNLFQSALGYPLFGTEGQLFAVLTLYARGLEHFTKAHLRLLETMASKLSLAFSNALQNAAPSPEMGTDFFTGLATSGRFFLRVESELARCRGNDTRVAVTSCSLPALNWITEQHGVTEANRVIRELAQALRRADSGRSFLARIGYDEFALVTPGLHLFTASQRMAALQEEIRAAVGLADPGLPASAAIGTALSPVDAEMPEALLAIAVRRMKLAAQSLAMSESDALQPLPVQARGA